MKFIHSFRTRLFTGFLAASLVPVLVCSSMLLQIFRHKSYLQPRE